MMEEGERCFAPGQKWKSDSKESLVPSRDIDWWKKEESRSGDSSAR